MAAQQLGCERGTVSSPARRLRAKARRRRQAHHPLVHPRVAARTSVRESEDLDMAISVTLMVLPESQEQAAQVVDVLSRAAAGLAFEGQTVSLSLTNYEED